MASIRKEVLIYRRPGDVWAAVRDWGAVHELAPGYVVATELDGDDRIVTFFNGAVAKELFVDLDEDRHRLVWSVSESPLGLAHHNASAQVIAENGATRFVWIADVLPHELAPAVGEMMDAGIAAIKTALEARSAAA